MVAISAVGLPSLLTTEANTALEGEPPDNIQRVGRAEQAYQVRQKAALYQRNLPTPKNLPNGDEELYANRLGNYSKALPHNSLGEVDSKSYDTMLKALSSGDPADFERIPLGGKIKLSNPQSALTFCLEGADSHHLGIGAPPAFSSAETAAEMVELYWQSLTRDVPFVEYDNHPLTLKAAAELSKLSDFRGPRVEGRVTPETLFRGLTPGDLNGPYLSQFLLKNIPYGSIPVVQRIRTAVPELNYMTSYEEWLAVQNGAKTAAMKFDPTPRFIGTARDLTAFVHEDFTYQACLNACLILLGMKVPFDMEDPYMMSRNQSGFSTFGAPHVLDAVARVANAALKAAWYQKWLVHRRLRPEEFGGAVHRTQKSQAQYQIHKEVLDSQALAETFSQNGSYLLPQSYPEGCPTHPSYPAGHAVIAGACATALKAFFEESFVIPEPVKCNANGLALSAYKGSELTVGGELNKLATNIAIGRNAAGVHWRSDAINGLKLGEAVAISIFADGGGCLSENFSGFGLTKFDGTTIVV
jgi:membrane-associated phospholipid phosphatase